MLASLKGAVDDFRNALRGADPLQPAPVAAPPTAPALPPTPEPGPRSVPPVPSAVPTAGVRRTARAWLTDWRVRVGIGGVLAGLLVLRWAPWSVPEPADPAVVATYGGGVVTREQLTREWAALLPELRPGYSSVEGLRALVASIAAHEAARLWAEERKVDQNAMFKDAIKHVTEQIRLEDVSDQLHQGRIRVGEEEIQRFYDENRPQFGQRPLVEVKEQIRALLVEQKEAPFIDEYVKDLKERASLQVDYRLLDVPEPAEAELVAYYQADRQRFRVPEQASVAQIQVSISLAGGDPKAKAKADSARARAAAGESFAELARALSDGRERARGGELASPVPRGARSAVFDEAVFTLPEGQLSPVFKEDDSYYVVRLLQRWPERLRPYEEVRDEVARAVRAEREGQVYAERAERTLFTMRARRTTLGEFLAEVAELPPEVPQLYAGPEGQRRLLDQFIERLLVVDDAASAGADTKRAEDIRHARTDVLAELLHEEQVDERARVTDDEVRAEYQRNRARYAEPPRVRVRYIRVARGTTADSDQKARAKIEEAYRKVQPTGLLGRGAPAAGFADVARQYSEDQQTAVNGGELPRWITEDGDPAASPLEHTLHDQLLPLKVGELTPILPLGDSYYLFQILEKEEARQRPFEEARDDVRRDLEDRKHEALNRAMETELLKRMRLQVFDRRLRTLLDELAATPGPASTGASGR